LQTDRAAARRALGLPDTGEIVAVLPGSRVGEVTRLASPFAGAAAWLASRRPGVRFVAPMASAATRERFEAEWQRCAPQTPVTIVDGRSRDVLAAADVVLVASGTATLETLLTRRPMVVAYRLGAITAFLLQRFGLVKVRFFSQPNLLVGREVVPEFVQGRANPETLGRALLEWFVEPARWAHLEREFEEVHLALRQDGAALAADAVVELLP
jgi:lipid-A-disaccharide synthase